MGITTKLGNLPFVIRRVAQGLWSTTSYSSYSTLWAWRALIPGCCPHCAVTTQVRSQKTLQKVLIAKHWTNRPTSRFSNSLPTTGIPGDSKVSTYTSLIALLFRIRTKSPSPSLPCSTANGHQYVPKSCNTSGQYVYGGGRCQSSTSGKLLLIFSHLYVS